MVTRTLTLPIRSVIRDGEESPLVLDAFRDSWRIGTDLANWCQRELVTYDARRDPGMVKMPKYEHSQFPDGSSLYQRVNAACPFRAMFDGAAGSMGSIVRAVENTWRSHPRFGRFAVIWKGESSPCVFKYPYPWPVRSQELRIFRDNENRPRASITIPGGRVEIRLADGPEFRRQLRQFDELISNVSNIGEAKISGHRRDGRLVGAKLHIVGDFEVAERPEASNVCYLHTDPGALLVAEINGRKVTVTNGDHIQRALKIITVTNARHKSFLERTRQDKKHEVRMSPDQLRNLESKISQRCDKQNNRIRTAIQQIAAQVAHLCSRQNVAIIAYDDRNKEYVPSFAWDALKQRIKAVFVGEMSGEWIDGQFTQFSTNEERSSWLQLARNTASAGRKAVAASRRSGSHPKVSRSCRVRKSKPVSAST